MPGIEGLIEAARHRPFLWGEHDCGSFAADVVERVTGRDPAPTQRRTYRNRFGAMRLILRSGGMRAFGARFGREIPPKFARRGDIVLLGTPGWETFAVCLGRRSAAPGAEGLVFAPTRLAIAAWRPEES